MSWDIILRTCFIRLTQKNFYNFYQNKFKESFMEFHVQKFVILLLYLIFVFCIVYYGVVFLMYNLYFSMWSWFGNKLKYTQTEQKYEFPADADIYDEILMLVM